jgi:hypothetical protein
MGLLRGTAKWAKIVGNPSKGYNEGEREWSFDLVIDKETEKALLDEGMHKDYLRENKEGETYIKFVRKELNKDGDPSKPFAIIDHRGNDWGRDLIGNGSILNVKYALNKVTVRGQDKMKPSAIKIQVWDLVKYEGKGDFPTKEATEVTEESWA